MSLRAVSVRVWELSGAETCHQHVCLCMSDIYLADVFYGMVLLLYHTQPEVVSKDTNSLFCANILIILVDCYTYERLASHSLIFCISFRQGICLQCSQE